MGPMRKGQGRGGSSDDILGLTSLSVTGNFNLKKVCDSTYNLLWWIWKAGHLTILRHPPSLPNRRYARDADSSM